MLGNNDEKGEVKRMQRILIVDDNQDIRGCDALDLEN